MRQLRRLRQLLALALCCAPPAAADGLGANDCTAEPFDGTSENAYGVNPGFTAEWCSAINQPPQECRSGKYYYANIEAELSRTASGSANMTYYVQFRSGDGASAPGGVVLGPANGYASGVPLFPASIRDVTAMTNETILSEEEPTLTCLGLVGAASPNQFLTVDRSGTTAAVPCWAGNPPTINELCTSFDPTMRALRLARSAGGWGGPCGGDQMVPPDPTPLRCAQRWWRQAGNVYGVEIHHDLTAVTDAGVNRGSPGVNGPRLLTLSPPYTSPILLNGVNLTPFLPDLTAGRLYLELLSSTADVRSQILPADLIVQCDHEIGDVEQCYSSVER